MKFIWYALPLAGLLSSAFGIKFIGEPEGESEVDWTQDNLEDAYEAARAVALEGTISSIGFLGDTIVSFFTATEGGITCSLSRLNYDPASVQFLDPDLSGTPEFVANELDGNNPGIVYVQSDNGGQNGWVATFHVAACGFEDDRKMKRQEGDFPEDYVELLREKACDD